MNIVINTADISYVEDFQIWTGLREDVSNASCLLPLSLSGKSDISDFLGQSGLSFFNLSQFLDLLFQGGPGVWQTRFGESSFPLL